MNYCPALERREIKMQIEKSTTALAAFPPDPRHDTVIINYYIQRKLMPFIRVWVHYVWATKERMPILVSPFRQELFNHIKDNAVKKNIFLDRINGYHDHVHCLVSLRSDQSIDKVAQLLKGESSFWFNNKSGFPAKKLTWQDDYFAVSVSESKLDVVRNYIDNQESHHQQKSFQDEYQEFISKYPFSSL